MQLTLEQAAEWMVGTSAGQREKQSIGPGVATGYSIDSRTVKPGELFFAVEGERLDGHDFVEAALDRGAIAAVVSKEKLRRFNPQLQSRLIVVDEPLEALQKLAAMVRRHWGKRVIGVTGSAGKTTTKEGIAQVLGEKFHVLKSQGNLNNGFGLPLQLLMLEPEHDVAVIEMGMNHAGEIETLAKIAAPEWGLVSNVGPVHLENFADGIRGIARAKYELVEALPKDGIAFLNCDDPYVAQFGRGMQGRAVYFGMGPCAELRAEDISEMGDSGVRFTAIAGEQHAVVRLRLLGRHNVYNALAGILVGLKSSMTLTECVTAIEELTASDKRGQVLRVDARGGQATVINDCYNSNPRALNAMVEALIAVPARRRIVIAGEMLELGEQAAALHRGCGEHMAALGVQIVIGVRGHARSLVEGARQGNVNAEFLATPEDAGMWLRGELRDGDAVLLKASRGVRLERALDWLKP